MKSDFIAVEEGQHELKRHLGWFQLVVIGIGAIIGAGIFVITGKAAAAYAGPAIVVSFILAAIICIFAGLCYAELSSLIPSAGGAYSYSYVAMGELPAWIIGWCIAGQYILSCATVAAGWAGYLGSFLKDWGLAIPQFYSSPPFQYSVETGWSLTGNFLNLPASILVLLIGVMVAVGIRAVAHFNNIMVVIKICTILLFVIIGLPHIHPDNWTPFIPENQGIFGEFGWSGVIRAAGLLFFAFIGFDTVSTLAQDAKNPQKDLPRGILGSLGISTIAYIAIALVLTGVVSYKSLGVPDPMAVALNAMGPSFFWISTLVKVAILSALASVVLIQILGQSRIFMSISSDGLLPASFSKIHHKLRTPVFSTAITAIAVAVLTGLFPVEILGQFVSMITLLIFAIVCLGVLILRRTHKEFKRTFKVPFVPVIPLLGILACCGQMAFLPGVTWVQLIIWFVVGICIYFGYSYKHSKLRLK